MTEHFRSLSPKDNKTNVIFDAHEEMDFQERCEEEVRFYSQACILLIHAGYPHDFAFNEMARYQCRENSIKSSEREGTRKWRLSVEEFIADAIVTKIFGQGDPWSYRDLRDRRPADPMPPQE